MSEWISVNDRLPDEEHVTVAVLCESGNVLTAWAVFSHFLTVPRRTEFAEWVFHHGEDHGEETITHWYPLPDTDTARAEG